MRANIVIIIPINVMKLSLAGTHSLGNHLGTLLRDAEQKVRELAAPPEVQQQSVAQFNSRASFNIIGEWCPGH